MLDLIRSLVVSNTTKIVLLSLDGLGGLPRWQGWVPMHRQEAPAGHVGGFVRDQPDQWWRHHLGLDHLLPVET